jgi:CBS domain containing-hemolysin-like protein
VSDHRAGKAKKQSGEKKRDHWIPRIFVLSIVISAVFSLISSQVLNDAGYVVAFLLLAAFILIGVVFDMIGVAVTVADERVFHSMAAHGNKHAAVALRLIRGAEKVSSVCNDVVGDISGIVSGSTAAVVVTRLCASFDLDSLAISVALSALVSGLTIGGKAIGKKAAINNSTQVVDTVSRVLYVFKRK